MRRLVASLTAVAALAALAGVAAAESSTAVRAHNIAAARRDADAHVALVELPAGATVVTSEPSGDHAYLKLQESLGFDSAHVVAHRWWTLAGTPSALIAYVEAHPPAGSTQSGTGTSSNSHTGSSALSVYFEWPAVGQTLGERELAVTATALPDGETGVLAEAQSDWIVPRPSSERLPRGIGEIDVTAGLPGRRPTVKMSVTGAGRVRRIVALVDGLAAAQPIVYFCPVESDDVRDITLSFRARAGGPVLAQLDYSIDHPFTEPGGACDSSLVFTIDGGRQAPLTGGLLLTRLESILGVRLV